MTPSYQDVGPEIWTAQDILDAITGHGNRSAADSYGEFPVEALFREISKIPKVELQKRSSNPAPGGVVGMDIVGKEPRCKQSSYF